MSKNMKNILVPKLRFPEFKDSEEWVLEEMGNIFSARQDKGFEDLPLLSLTEKEGIIPQEETNRKNNSSSDKSKYLRVCPGDVAYNTMRMWEGRSAYVSIEGLVSPAYTVCKPIGDNNGLFFSYYFKTSDLIKEFHRYSQGLVKDTLNLKYEAFSKIIVPNALSQEQHKIADCLSSIDELISVQSQKIKALVIHKNSLMQNFFPRLNETTPNLRFPEFQHVGEWDETTIGKIGSFYYGKSAPKWSLEENAPTKCVRYGELYTKFGAIITETYSRTNIDPSNLKFSKGGEILVPRVGEKPEEFGKCCSYLPLGNIAIGEMISVFETTQNPLFYTYYFRRMYRQFANVVEGQNVKNLYYVVLEPITICRPTLLEQKKIAACLTSIDELISAQSQKLDNLKAHKKGLMQALFPVVVGVNI